MQVDGASLSDSQARFYRALKARDAALAGRCLDAYKRKNVLQKKQQEDVLSRLKKEAVDLPALFGLDNAGVHTFSIGCLDAYFYLSEAVASGKAFLFRGRILVMPLYGLKTLVFDSRPEDLSALLELQKQGVVYSIGSIPGLQKQSKFVEIAYDLKTLFNPASYKNRQKYRTRVALPVKRAESGGLVVEPLTRQNYGLVRELHDQWVAHKLADERTYKLMFPVGRYIRCAKLAVQGASAPGVEYRGLVLRTDKEAVAVRVFSVERGRSYELALFGRTWDPRFPRVTESVNLWSRRRLLNEGVTVDNVGATVNKGHRAFKTKYPYVEVVSHIYGRAK